MIDCGIKKICMTQCFLAFSRDIYITQMACWFLSPSQPRRVNKSIVLIKLMERAWARKMGGGALCRSLLLLVGGALVKTPRISGPLFPCLGMGMVITDC